jgi:hypothetical protein
MPQGLPKKIEVGLLLADLALQLGNPLSRRRSVIEQGTAQRRSIQSAPPRPPGPAQRFQPTASSLLLPLIYSSAVDPQSRRHIGHRLAGRHPIYRSPLNLSRRV